jgi:hypothetical protein
MVSRRIFLLYLLTVMPSIPSGGRSRSPIEIRASGSGKPLIVASVYIMLADPCFYTVLYISLNQWHTPGSTDRSLQLTNKRRISDLDEPDTRELPKKPRLSGESSSNFPIAPSILVDEFTKSTTPDPADASALQALYDMAWGKTWPQVQRTINETEMTAGSVDDDDDGDGDGVLADKLRIPSTFSYVCLKEMKVLKRGLRIDSDEDDALVVREDYKKLYKELEEGVYETVKDIVVTGHPGIGSCESWFSSLESKADFSPILRQEHLSLLPSFISS